MITNIKQITDKIYSDSVKEIAEKIKCYGNFRYWSGWAVAMIGFIIGFTIYRLLF